MVKTGLTSALWIRAGCCAQAAAACEATQECYKLLLLGLMDAAARDAEVRPE